jgi:hypothetical protein
MRPFLIQAPGQGRKALRSEDFPHGGRAQGTVALFEGLADFIDRVILFAQLNDQVAGGRFLGLGLGAMARSHEEDRLKLAAEVVAQDVKGVEGVAEGTGDLFAGMPLEQKSAQGLVLAVFRQARFEKEAAELT